MALLSQVEHLFGHHLSDLSAGCALNALGEFTSLKFKHLTIENNVGYRQGVINLTSSGANDVNIEVENVIIKK